ncbi:hypothetical protein ACWCOW_27215 [Streptomyces sp. NPDC001939]
MALDRDHVDDGTVTFGIAYVKVDDIVTMLDASSKPSPPSARPDPGEW